MKIPQDIKRYALKRKLLRIAIWLSCVGVFSFAFFSSWKSIEDSKYTTIRVVIFVGILVASVFAFGIPKIFYEKSFKGKIVHLNFVTKGESDMRMGAIESLYRRVWINAEIKLDSGKIIHKEIASKRTQRLTVPSKYRNDPDGTIFAGQYSVGDTVIYIAGTKYCQVYSEDKENLTCVACGEFNSFDNTHCDKCGHTILRG